MPTTYKLIQATTVGSGGSATVSFSSIPQTYTDLVVLSSIRSTSTATNTGEYDPMAYRFNGTASGYTTRIVDGNGSGAFSGAPTTVTAFGGGTYGRMTDGGINNSLSGTSIFSSFSLYIPGYAGSTNKSWSLEYAEERNVTANYLGFVAGLWSNTAAITSITFALVNGNIAEYSSFSLYGIKNS